MNDVLQQAQEKLVQVGTDLTVSVIFFITSIIVIGTITYIVLTILNNKKPEEKRKSNIAIFLISVFVGWAITTLIFVYRVVMIGLERLSQ